MAAWLSMCKGKAFLRHQCDELVHAVSSWKMLESRLKSTISSTDTVNLAGMTWGEGDRWTTEVMLAPGTYDFKLVIMREDSSVAAWEPGQDRSITVSSSRR